jgi:hypothetical protein
MPLRFLKKAKRRADSIKTRMEKKRRLGLPTMPPMLREMNPLKIKY